MRRPDGLKAPGPWLRDETSWEGSAICSVFSLGKKSAGFQEWGAGALLQALGRYDVLLSQILLRCGFAGDLGQTLSVVIEQKVFGFRLEQAKLSWTPLSISPKLNLLVKQHLLKDFHLVCPRHYSMVWGYG